MAGSIRVTPETLNALADQVRGNAERVGEVASDTQAKSHAETDESELQASLNAFNRVWQNSAIQACTAGTSLAKAISQAARSYRDNDQLITEMIQPVPPPGGIGPTHSPDAAAQPASATRPDREDLGTAPDVDLLAPADPTASEAPSDQSTDR